MILYQLANWQLITSSFPVYHKLYYNSRLYCKDYVTLGHRKLNCAGWSGGRDKVQAVLSPYLNSMSWNPGEVCFR